MTQYVGLLFSFRFHGLFVMTASTEIINDSLQECLKILEKTNM